MTLLSLAVRCLIVPLFLFSALDKVLNHRGAMKQAGEATSSRPVAAALLFAGFLIEVLCSAGLLTGVADRAAALVLAAYCGITAILWKRFWAPRDFWVAGPSRARSLFWDFFKNVALGGALLLITLATGPFSLDPFRAAPLSSTLLPR